MATGEGLTYMALICYAENPEDAINQFSNRFDPYFAIGASVDPGIKFDIPGGELLFSDALRQSMLKWHDKGYINFYSSIHVNFS